MLSAFGPELLAQIESGDDEALLCGVISTACLWLEFSGVALSFHGVPTAAHCVASDSPAKGALMAAAKDVLAVLALSPQGRKALFQFCGKPVLQEPKGE